MFVKNKLIFSLLCAAIAVVFGNMEVVANNCNANITSINATVGNCQYSVDICWECSPTGLQGHFSIVGVDKIDPRCTTNLSLGEVEEDLITQLNTIGWYVSLCTEMPPCSVDRYSYTVRKNRCWKKYHWSGGGFSYSACDYQYYCAKQWEACEGPGGINLTEITPWEEEGGEPDCEGDEPEDFEVPPMTQSDCWLEYEECEPE